MCFMEVNAFKETRKSHSIVEIPSKGHPLLLATFNFGLRDWLRGPVKPTNAHRFVVRALAGLGLDVNLIGPVY
jgi:hypothetical protein